MREDFDCGKETTLEDEQCPHDVATLLKEYLRELPDPLLCRDLYPAFVQTQSEKKNNIYNKLLFFQKKLSTRNIFPRKVYSERYQYYIEILALSKDNPSERFFLIEAIGMFT